MKKIEMGPFALLLKLGPKILSVLAKLLKTLKVGKVGLAAVSFASYSYLFTWQFALAIIALILIHESGHIWMMKRYGMKTKGIYLIPLLGGVSVGNERTFPSRKGEADIALMGPIWGLIATVITAGIYFVTNEAFFAAAAGWMAMVNLVNLLPVNPLDGGRILKSIAFSVNSRLGMLSLYAGLIACGIILYETELFLFFLLLIFGWLDVSMERSNLKKAEEELRLTDTPDKTYPKKLEPMSTKNIILISTGYVATIGILWGLMYMMNHIPEVDIARQLFMH